MIMKNFYVTIGLADKRSSLPDERINEFNKHSHYISSLYSSFLKDMKVKGLGRVTIELFADNDSRTYVSKPSYMVSVVQKYFEINKFDFDTDFKSKSKMILDLLHGILLEISSKLRLNKSLLENAYESVVNNNF